MIGSSVMKELNEHIQTLRGKRPDTEFFQVLIFLYLDWIQENADQKNFRIWTLFTEWHSAEVKSEDVKHMSNDKQTRFIR